MFFIKNNSKLYNFLKFFFSYPISNFMILSLIASFFYNIDFFFYIINNINNINLIILFFFFYDFIYFFFKFFFIFNLGCLTSILFLNLKEKEFLNLKLKEKYQKYLYNFFIFFLFFLFIIFFYHFFIFLNKKDIVIYFFLFNFIVFLFKKIKNFYNYNYENNEYFFFYNKNLIFNILILNLIIFIIFNINIYIFFEEFFYSGIYINFFYEIIIFNLGCILSILFLNFKEENCLNLKNKQELFIFYLFYYFLLFFIFIFILYFFIFFYKIIFLGILKTPFFGTYKSIIFFYFFIYIYIFYFFLNLFLNKNKYDFNFIKNICIYIFFFCIFCILISYLIILFKYLLSLIIINVYAMEDNIINEEDKKLIKNNGLGFQRTNITNDRIFIGRCFLNINFNYFLNNIEKECKLSPVRRRIFIVNQIWPIQDFICEEVHELGFYMKDNILNIDDDISCYTMEIKKFNNDEHNL